MASARRSAHGELDELRQRTAAERVKLRDLEAALAAAKLEVDRAGEAIAEGYASEDERLATRHGAMRAVAQARKAQEVAIERVKELQRRLGGAEIRVEPAQRETDAFAAEHARDLIAELEAKAVEAASNLTRAGGRGVRRYRACVTVREEIDSLVATVPGATPRADGPEPSFPWERQLRELERAIRAEPEVPPPLPRWAGLNHRAEQDKAARVERARRSGELSADNRAALALGRVVTIE